jgi:hypothetical protein
MGVAAYAVVGGDRKLAYVGALKAASDCGVPFILLGWGGRHMSVCLLFWCVCVRGRGGAGGGGGGISRCVHHAGLCLNCFTYSCVHVRAHMSIRIRVCRRIGICY